VSGNGSYTGFIMRLSLEWRRWAVWVNHDTQQHTHRMRYSYMNHLVAGPERLRAVKQWLHISVYFSILKFYRCSACRQDNWNRWEYLLRSHPRYSSLLHYRLMKFHLCTLIGEHKTIGNLTNDWGEQEGIKHGTNRFSSSSFPDPQKLLSNREKRSNVSKVCTVV
jgi:hypothetical protein